jgi:MFS family permease
MAARCHATGIGVALNRDGGSAVRDPDREPTMTVLTDRAPARAGITRGAVTWYAYLLLGYFTYFNTSQGNIIPFLQAELALSYGAVSLHASATACGLLVIGLTGDRIITRFGRRAMLIFGALASAVALTCLAFAPSVYATVASCFFMGLTGAFIPAIISALLSDLYGDRRDIALTEANAMCYAFAIAAPLLAALAVWAGWSWRLVPLAGVASAVLIVVAYRKHPIPEGAAFAADGKQRALPPAYWAYWAMLGFAVALEFAVLLWAPAFLERVAGLSPSNAALGAGAFFVAMLAGRTLGIPIVSRYPARNIYLAITAITIAGFTLYWGAPAPAASVAGLFVIGLGIALFFPIVISFALGAAPGASNRAATRSMLAPALAVILTPPLLGVLADNVGLWWAQGMILVFVALTMAAFLVAKRLEGYSTSSS